MIPATRPSLEIGRLRQDQRHREVVTIVLAALTDGSEQQACLVMPIAEGEAVCVGLGGRAQHVHSGQAALEVLGLLQQGPERLGMRPPVLGLSDEGVTQQPRHLRVQRLSRQELARVREKGRDVALAGIPVGLHAYGEPEPTAGPAGPPG